MNKQYAPRFRWILRGGFFLSLFCFYWVSYAIQPSKSIITGEMACQAAIDTKLKAVVHLGASGYDYFIIEIDEKANWDLRKAEFGKNYSREGLFTESVVLKTLREYIDEIVQFTYQGKRVGAADIHFVVSSGALKQTKTRTAIEAIESLNYVVNKVSGQEEAFYGYRATMAKDSRQTSFFVDIGSGNTKIVWMTSEGKLNHRIAEGSMYFLEGHIDIDVYKSVLNIVKEIPGANHRQCFMIGGVPYQLAKNIRQGNESHTRLKSANTYSIEKDFSFNSPDDRAKLHGGLNIYKALADGTGCQAFYFDWRANFTIGFLLDLPF